MTTLALLWLPILLSAVFVFVASSVIHMMTPMHKSDYKKLPDESKVLEAMRGNKVEPGQYMFPGCTSMKDMGNPEMLAKYQQGPVGSMIVRNNGMPSMGKCLGLWFLFCLGVSCFTAYLTGHGVDRGHGHFAMQDVFKVAFFAAVLGHSFTHFVDAIWKGLSWATTIKFLIDGLIYAVVTAATFAWLWPASAP